MVTARVFPARKGRSEMSKILVVEDEKNIADTISDMLSFEGHVVEIVDNGGDALQLLKISEFELIVLDWGLPGKSGLEVLSLYRAAGGNAPVLMLTAKRQVEERECGLDSGADDYLTKPFHMRELAARVRALLRRPAALMDNVLQAGYLRLDRGTHSLTREGHPVRLLPREFDLLEFFMRHPNQIFSLNSLLNHIWRSDTDASPAAVRQCIKRLRKKIDVQDGQSLIESVHGVGYKFGPPRS